MVAVHGENIVPWIVVAADHTLIGQLLAVAVADTAAAVALDSTDLDHPASQVAEHWSHVDVRKRSEPLVMHYRDNIGTIPAVVAGQLAAAATSGLAVKAAEAPSPFWPSHDNIV